MPNAVTHVLAAMFVAEIIRQFVVKKKFSSLYVLIAGIAGLFPDIDIMIYWVLSLFTQVPLADVHRQFTHSLFVPLLFIIVAIVVYQSRQMFLTLSMVALGCFIHIVLDGALSGGIMPFYPLTNYVFNLNLISNIFGAVASTVLIGMDAILLVLWLVYEYRKRYIKQFM